jgi:hypothetical protein
MGKYSGKYSGSSTQQGSSVSGPKETHYIWRGIGCLMILIIPAISIASAYQTIDYGLANNWPIPYQMLQPVRLPSYFYATQGLRTILNPLSSISNFYAVAAISLFYMMLIGGVISVVYAAVYRMVGPSRYGPTDAPPTKYKATRKSR